MPLYHPQLSSAQTISILTDRLLATEITSAAQAQDISQSEYYLCVCMFVSLCICLFVFMYLRHRERERAGKRESSDNIDSIRYITCHRNNFCCIGSERLQELVLWLFVCVCFCAFVCLCVCVCTFLCV